MWSDVHMGYKEGKVEEETQGQKYGKGDGGSNQSSWNDWVFEGSYISITFQLHVDYTRKEIIKGYS